MRLSGCSVRVIKAATETERIDTARRSRIIARKKIVDITHARCVATEAPERIR